MSSDLHGLKVWVTRPAEQAEPWMRRLSHLGARPILVSAIQIEWAPPHELATSCLEARSSDWIVFTSVNGVRAFATAMGPAPAFAHVRTACVGAVTAHELDAIGLTPSVVAHKGNSANLAEMLADKVCGTVTWFRGNLADPEFEARLVAAGAKAVVSVEAYKTTPRAVEPACVEEPDVILLSSASAAHSVAAGLRASAYAHWIVDKPCFVLGTQTLAAATQEGMLIGGVAAQPTLESLIEAVLHRQDPSDV